MLRRFLFSAMSSPIAMSSTPEESTVLYPLLRRRSMERVARGSGDASALAELPTRSRTGARAIPRVR